jgi:ADP-heptose:LPS heptosyltransferase
MPWRTLFSRIPVRLLARLIMARFGRPIGSAPRPIEQVRHIAVVHWDNLGDAVLLSPVLRELRQTTPTARIVLLYNENNHEVFANCPYVDVLRPQTVQMSAKFDSPHGASLGRRRCTMDAARLLAVEARRSGPIDLLIGPDWLDPVYGASFFDSVLFRAGGGRRLLRRQRCESLTRIEIRQHHVLRNLDIVRALGVKVADDRLEFWTTPHEKVLAADLLAGLETARPTVVIALGAGASRRRWPVERYGSVADELLARTAAQIVLVGGEDARCAAVEVQERSHSVVADLVGKTSIGVLAEVLRRSDLVIGNDSGPAHVAAAVGTAEVVVSAHPLDGDPWVVNSPNRYRPWGVPSVVLQPPSRLESCRDQPTCLDGEAHCILSVSEVDVVEAAVGLLAGMGVDEP